MPEAYQQSRRFSRRSLLGGIVAAGGITATGELGFGSSFASAQVSARCEKPSWVATWALPVHNATSGYARQTLRIVTTPSFGGGRVRVRLSNALGEAPVTLAAVHAGLVANGAALKPGSNVPVTFDGAQEVRIPVGGSVLSDPVALSVEAFKPMAVSVYAPSPTGPATGHDALATMYVADGNRAAAEDGGGFGSPSAGARFLTAVDVFAPNDGAVVALGDSITEGFSRERNAFGESGPYTATLARRLHAYADNGGPRLSVVNVGISGNRVREDGFGPSALDRLDRDVLAQSGLAAVVMMEGINDLAPLAELTGGVTNPAPPTAEQMAFAYSDIVERVRAAGARIWLSPLTPAGDSKRPTPFTHSITPAHVERRHEINRWIRSHSGAYDGRVDFETVVLDPQWPNWIAPEYDTGDNLHPNNDGLVAMGESIDLSLFEQFRCDASGRDGKAA